MAFPLIAGSSSTVALQFLARNVVRFDKCIVHFQSVYASKRRGLRVERRSNVHTSFDILRRILSLSDSGVEQADVMIAE